MRCFVSIDARVDLVVAALDLKVVRLVRDAIRTADLSAGGVPGPLGTVVFRNAAARARVIPEPRFEPRVVYHPQPRFEPRQTIHPQATYAPAPLIEQPPTVLCEPEQPVRNRCPIQPPWRVLPWEIPAQPAPKVKVVVVRPDIVSKGSLIDFFI